MTHTTTHPFDREILFTPRRSDFVYDVFVGTEWVASARYQGAGDFVADEVCYAHVLAHPAIDPATLIIRASTPAQLAACVADTPRCGCGDSATLIIYDGDNTPLPSCERCFEIEYVQDTEGGQDWTVEPLTDPRTPIGPCYVCGNPAWQADAAGLLCPEHAGVLAMFEGERAVRPITADAALPQHPGPRCDCPACQRATDRLADAAMMYRLCLEAGLLCQYCGEAHADAACPQRQSVLPAVQPHCGNCGGRHAIQVCPAIRQMLFA